MDDPVATDKKGPGILIRTLLEPVVQRSDDDTMKQVNNHNQQLQLNDCHEDGHGLMGVELARRPRNGDICVVHYDCYVLNEEQEGQAEISDNTPEPTRATASTGRRRGIGGVGGRSNNFRVHKTLVETTRHHQHGKELPLSFEVGSGDVISGLEVAVQRMMVGQHVELTVPPLFAYGTRGHPPEIPPSATLLFELELVRIEPRPDNGGRPKSRWLPWWGWR